MIFRVLKKAMIESNERKRLRKGDKSFLKLRSKRAKLAENNAKKASV